MEKRIGIFLLAPLLLFWHWFEPAARRNQKGISAYAQKKYELALQYFLSAKGSKPNAAALKNNTASTLYQLKKYQEAMEEFSRIQPPREIGAKADFLYNLGNTAFRLEQWENALAYYRKCLRANPQDMDAKKNYELTQKKIEQQKQQQQPQQDQQQKTDQNQQQNPLMQFLNQNEKEQMEKKKRPVQKQRREKDW